MLTHRQINNIESKFGTPFYIFDEMAFNKNYRDIVKAFGSRYKKFIPAYSYKTNYIPYLCRIIKSKGGFAEVVSRMEYDLALKIGQQAERIVFNGPVKHYEDIAIALKNRSIVNLDSWTEIDYVEEYAKRNPEKTVKVGLRINISLPDKTGQSHIQEKLKIGRFGFEPSETNLNKLVQRLAKTGNIKINSLHGHTSTTDRSVWCYEVIAKTLCKIAEKYFAESVEYVNIGGGIFGYIPPQMRWAKMPSFDDYAGAICKVMNQNNWVNHQKPYLVLEPGIAMAANALSFVTKVISVKEIRRKLFVTVDGSAYNIKPSFHKINQPHQIIKKNRTAQSETFNVVGSTCMEKDYLLTEVKDLMPEVGDFVKVDNVGAYTIVLTPPFINTAPPILVKKGINYKAIRTRQKLKDVFNNYYFS